MAKKNIHTYERDLLSKKHDLTEEEKAMFSEYNITDDDLNEMSGFLDSVEDWSEDDSIKPSSKLSPS